MHRRKVSTALLACSLMGLCGCISKSYMRNQVTPMIENVNRLDEETARNGNEIRQTETRASDSMDTLNEQTQQAAANANDADQQATLAQRGADEALQETMNLTTVVSNLDAYNLVAAVSVHFEPGKAELGSAAQQELNTVGAQVSSAGTYVIAIQGRTDSTGSQQANYTLSKKRADVIVKYLSANFNIPAFKMHLVGLGSDRPVVPNNTAAGRAENRCAEVKIYSRSIRVGSVPSGQTGSGSSDDDDENGEWK